jgi:hypothetical protein
MKAILQFVPKHFEKAVDLARNVSTFAKLEFSPTTLRMRITDPVKVLHMDLILTPDVYKCDEDFSFGINLQMFYKLLKALDNNQELEIEADESVMKINQLQHYHTLINQEIKSPPSLMETVVGPKVILGTKLLQRYVRALANAAPVVELHYAPTSDVLFLESVSSMYRTLFSLDTAASPNTCDEYRKRFILKFLDTAINPSLADKVELTLGDSLVLHYQSPTVAAWITQASYTEA